MVDAEFALAVAVEHARDAGHRSQQRRDRRDVALVAHVDVGALVVGDRERAAGAAVELY